MMVNIRAGEVPDVIRKTAEEFAGEFYDGGRSERFRTVGLSQKAYVRRYWTNFVADAVKILSQMLGLPGLPDGQKNEIAQAILDFQARASATTPLLSARSLN